LHSFATFLASFKNSSNASCDEKFCCNVQYTRFPYRTFRGSFPYLPLKSLIDRILKLLIFYFEIVIF
jgi:hypothetical protein